MLRSVRTSDNQVYAGNLSRPRAMGLIKFIHLRRAQRPDKIAEHAFGNADQLITMDAAAMF
ncbi:hypothetical protein [Desulfonatronospira thiodismutans]|uniref:hypothetical protein n=1 Tax=Desulfonatronospira thiodismutans TaxID=488939 RepID=UPI0001975B18|nr:hypothetical protein [Desulfonatronospira thiodismutans]